MLRGFFAGFLTLLFATAFIVVLIDWFDFSQRLHDSWTTPIVIAGLLLTGYVAVAARPQNAKGRILAPALFALGTAMLVPFIFVYDVFGTYDFGSILNAARENPPGEMAKVGLGSLSDKMVEYGIVAAALIVGAFYLVRRVPYFAPFAAVSGLVFALVSPLTTYAYRSVVPHPHHALIELPQDVQPPVIVSRPNDRKNIVFVYMESVERTYRDIPETAASFAPLAELEDAGISFRNIDQSYGMHFTAGGMLAATCGIPLLPNGIINVREQIRDTTTADYLQIDGFLSHVECLGDVLASDGYVGSYMNGSDLRVFSKGQLFEGQGYTRFHGVNLLPGPRDQTYENVWGLNDDTIFAYAEQELEYLAGLNRPFMMSMLTVSTHGPDAELDEGCTYPVVADSRLPAAIQCTGDHIHRLLGKLDDLGVADDTIVVILSDHLAMNNSLRDLLAPARDTRRNFVTVLGAGDPQVNVKYGTLMDLYPTVLELMGYELRDRRANMGVSLLSADATMIEDLGREVLHSAFKQNTALQDFLWNPDQFDNAVRLARD